MLDNIEIKHSGLKYFRSFWKNAKVSSLVFKINKSIVKDRILDGLLNDSRDNRFDCVNKL